MSYNHVCFDLDGVLINSISVMQTSWKAVQRIHGVSQSFDEYKQHIGIPFNNILSKIGISEDIHLEIKQTYDATSSRLVNQIELFGGVDAVLSELKSRHFCLSILTSKTKSRTDQILSQKDVKHYFDYIISPEDLPLGAAKPSPQGLQYLMGLSNSQSKEMLFLGDMQSDYDCAKKAEVDYCHCAYGYQPNVDSKVKINNIQEIIGVIK